LTPSQNLECGKSIANLVCKFQHIDRNSNKMHQGKCAAAIFVKSKGCLVTKIRNTCKWCWKEAVYSRNEEPKIADEESVESGQSSENLSPKRKPVG
jgi:hypothetical protein